MSRLIDKLVILIICVTASMLDKNSYIPIAVVLTGVGVSSLVQYFSGTAVSTVLIALCSCSCCVFPQMICVMPLMVYDALYEKKWWASLPAAGFLFGLDKLSNVQIMLSFSGILAAGLIFKRVSELENMVGTLTKLRDTVEERNKQLGDKNNRLLDMQDQQVYLATLKERNRIAREIHDNVGHMLTRSILQAGALKVLNKDDSLKEPISDLKDTLDSAMTSIRQSVHDLHDDSIDLRALIVESMRSAQGKFEVHLEYDMGDDIPANVKLGFIGIIKEGISNAVKHSAGDRIDITVREHPGFYQLSLTDNGACEEIRSTGMGINGMKERAESIGGMISFTPSESGFRIFMTVKK